MPTKKTHHKAKKNTYTHAERSKAAKKAARTKRKRYGKDLKKG